MATIDSLILIDFLLDFLDARIQQLSHDGIYLRSVSGATQEFSVLEYMIKDDALPAAPKSPRNPRDGRKDGVPCAGTIEFGHGS
jgi:hypothetical protein